MRDSKFAKNYYTLYFSHHHVLSFVFRVSYDGSSLNSINLLVVYIGKRKLQIMFELSRVYNDDEGSRPTSTKQILIKCFIPK